MMHLGKLTEQHYGVTSSRVSPTSANRQSFTIPAEFEGNSSNDRGSFRVANHNAQLYQTVVGEGLREGGPKRLKEQKN